MHVRLLGPVDVVQEGVPRPVRGVRRQAILAALALSPGRAVSADRLVEIVWDGQATAGSSRTLHSHISLLRDLLGDRTAIVTDSAGFRLSGAEQVTDVEAAKLLIEEAARAADPAEAGSRLDAAIALWRDRALAGLRDLSWFAVEAQRLDQLLSAARHKLIDIRLARGEHAELIPELEVLGHQQPLHEQVHGQLMLALYRSGRQSDALAVYERLRRTLDEEMGVAPSRPLRDLHAAILRQDADLDLAPVPAPVAGPRGRPLAVAALLPPAAAGFTGRGRELARLDELLTGLGTASMATAVISGTAGVGKTTLALHWAHRVRDRFPDGQLYVNLRGYDPSGTATDPAEAIRGFLDALDVPTGSIPTTASAQAALYRSLLAGRRMLVVLDNARDTQQVRPLLPATAGCLTIVTSRSALTQLVAVEGAQSLVLDLLSPGEARELLARRIGAARVDSEPDAVNDIIGSCARLPLALAVAAARAATHPGFPLTALAAELARTGNAEHLDRLDGGDASSEIRTVFHASYGTVSNGAARLFRLLGIHPGPDISTAAVASLAGLPTAAVPALLSELVNAGLLTEHAPNRYTFHDLLRAYAAEQARHHDNDTERRDATLRATDHYVHTAYQGLRLQQHLIVVAGRAVRRVSTHPDHQRH